MLTGPGSDEAFPPPVFPAPPLLAEFPPEPPLVAAPCSAPPGAPGCLPSGEIATFEARFPCGTFTTGAGGPGLEESAITLCRPSLPDAAETSGAAPASACTCLRCTAVIALIGSFGAATFVSVGAMLSGPA